MNTEKIVAYIIDNFEGDVFTNNPNDPGGATKYGITCRTLEFYRRRLTGNDSLVVTDSDVQAMTRGEAIDIGVSIFAAETGLEFIVNERIRFIVIDYAFHAGWVAAIKGLQTAIGVEADGICGSRTLNGINTIEIDDRIEFIGHHIIFYRQEAMLKQIYAYPKMKEFAFGWWKRIQFNQHIMLGWESL